MPQALLLALRQFDDPAFRTPLVRGALGAAAALLLLVVAAWYGTAWLATGQAGWIAAVAPWLGGAAALLLAWWLYLPVAVAIAGQFVGEVAAAVERRHYPGLPPPRGASLAAQAAWSIRFGLRMLLLQLLLLPLLLVPVLGFTIALVIAARFLGNGVFEGTAQLRMDTAGAAAERRRRPLQVWLLGLALALIGLVPLLNLVVPVLGTAASVHLLHRTGRASSGELRG